MFASWNSAIFSSIPFTVLPIAIVTNDFDRAHDQWPISNTITDTRIANVSSIYALQQRARNFTHLTNNECIDAFLDSRNASSELVMVSSTVTSQNVRNGTVSSLIEGFISGMDHDRWDAATNWVCDHDPANCTKDWLCLLLITGSFVVSKSNTVSSDHHETMKGDVGYTLARRFHCYRHLLVG
jgi:hypothetical protein